MWMSIDTQRFKTTTSRTTSIFPSTSIYNVDTEHEKKKVDRIWNFLWKEKAIVGKHETELWNPFNERGIKYTGRLNSFLAQYTINLSKEKDFLGIGPELPFQHPKVWRHRCFCVDHNSVNQIYFTLFMRVN